MQRLRYRLITRPSDPNVFVYRAGKYPNMLLLLWSTDTDISDGCMCTHGFVHYLQLLHTDLMMLCCCTINLCCAGFKDFGAAEFENLNGLIQSMDSQRDGGELVESVRRILHAPT